MTEYVIDYIDENGLPHMKPASEVMMQRQKLMEKRLAFIAQILAKMALSGSGSG